MDFPPALFSNHPIALRRIFAIISAHLTMPEIRAACLPYEFSDEDWQDRAEMYRFGAKWVMRDLPFEVRRRIWLAAVANRRAGKVTELQRRKMRLMEKLQR
jgi:hypothetical protein